MINLSAKVFCFVTLCSKLADAEKKLHRIITKPFPQRCYERLCVREGEKKRKDWQERCNYFESLCIIHERMLFQRPPENYIRIAHLSSLPILHSSSTRTRKSGHAAAFDYSFNENWCKCSSSHAYEPFISSPGGTKLWWQPWETWS